MLSEPEIRAALDAANKQLAHGAASNCVPCMIGFTHVVAALHLVLDDGSKVAATLRKHLDEATCHERN